MPKKTKTPPAGGKAPAQVPDGNKKESRKDWTGIWIDSESTKKDLDGGPVTVAKVKTNLTEEVDKLFGLTRSFSSVEIATMDGAQKVNAQIESYALKAGKKPGTFIATITVTGTRVFKSDDLPQRPRGRSAEAASARLGRRRTALD